MQSFRAFTMIELVFVIVVIGILSAIAIPKLAVTRDDAILVKGKSQVAAIRSGIAMQKSKALLQGDNTGLYNNHFRLKKLDSITIYNHSDDKLFYFGDGNTSNVLNYPIYSKKNHDGSWVKTAANKYVLILSDGNVSFDYNTTTGVFDCNQSTQNCKDLTR